MMDPHLIYHSLIAIVFFEGVLLIAARLMEGYDLRIVRVVISWYSSRTVLHQGSLGYCAPCRRIHHRHPGR